MQLSERLQTIAELVTPGNRLVDVGCDHGYLPIELIQRGIIPGAIAMDVNPGPLSRAREHIAANGLENQIETRLSDGLHALKEGEGDTLVIAGMGGPLMERILTEGAAVRDSFSELILQPQSDLPHFRRYIRGEGYEILEERMILEDGKYYPMMKAVRMDQEEAYSEAEYWFGRKLLQEKNPVLHKYLEREKRIRLGILKNLEKADQETAIVRRQEVKEELQQIEAALFYYENM
ncbi:MAG: class I SAM-dependent methyltransferase [Eubacteriales bacterium]|nr:class I SAM-dependent methyltransferase [Eubacteriales bacterium]